MSLPSPVPPRLLAAWERRTQPQREALEALLLGKHGGEWGMTAEMLAVVLKTSGDSVSASTIRTYRRVTELQKEINA